MTPRILGLSFLLLLALTETRGQLSPGDLTTAHAALEGMGNCTKCHDLGKSVSNTLCMDCHTEIRQRVNQNKGYHASAGVKSKNCFQCHSEHHGRNFAMIRFDEKTFDHNLTQYNLKGKHAVVDCRKCHTPAHIENSDLKKRKNTYLGLKQDCLSCHDDYHQKTLSNDCMKCHDMNAFRPASRFDHNKTDYILTGKHTEVDCKQCHKISPRNNKPFQFFADVKHDDCKACHEDPHKGNFSSSCTQCHEESSFTNFTGKVSFQHSTTGFVLKGKHKSVDCFDCHRKTPDPALVFEDRLHIAENNCIACHEDVHKGKFGNDCARCHSEKSFLVLKTMEFFDHSVTDYPLVGKHAGVDCRKCHTDKYTDAINFSACRNCHADYHKGEFARNGASPDCDKCHSITAGFTSTLYTVEEHQTIQFRLEGAHAATACVECHKSKDGWKFRNVGSSCTDCHENVHEKRFEKNGVTTCERCHDTNTWFPGKFDHNETKFKLEGKHAELECLACHKTFVEDGKTKVNYRIEKFECIDCHQ